MQDKDNNINIWTEEKSSPIEDIIRAKNLILKNKGLYFNSPYITGLVNYPEVKQILKESKCEYVKRYDYMNNLIIENVIDKHGLLLKNYKNLYLTLELHGAMLFLDKINIE